MDSNVKISMRDKNTFCSSEEIEDNLKMCLHSPWAWTAQAAWLSSPRQLWNLISH